ncbi:MAG: hypothetical protein Q9165_005051 [Trypethelium subeluteriae]
MVVMAAYKAINRTEITLWAEDIYAAHQAEHLSSSPLEEPTSPPSISHDYFADRVSQPESSSRQLHRQDPSKYSLAQSENGSERSMADSEASAKGATRTAFTKTLQLEFVKPPLLMCDFDDTERGGEELETVKKMRETIQLFADGLSVLGSDSHNLLGSLDRLPQMDRVRFRKFKDMVQSDELSRDTYGQTPPIDDLIKAVSTGKELDRSEGALEDRWNFYLHKPLIELVIATSTHAKALTLVSTKCTLIKPGYLLDASNSTYALPSAKIDYIICFAATRELEQIYEKIQCMPKTYIKTWNNARDFHQIPFAVNIETEPAATSWTEGKHQMAIWMHALLERFRYFESWKRVAEHASTKMPCFPLVLVQGHDWRVVILSEDDKQRIMWDSIMIGDTRNCFDLVKLVAVLHWILHWAVTEYLPWLKTIAP